MDNYDDLRAYLRAKAAGGFGWKVGFDKSLSPDMDYAFLSGCYARLLDKALDWVPPALQKELMRGATEHKAE